MLYLDTNIYSLDTHRNGEKKIQNHPLLSRFVRSSNMLKAITLHICSTSDKKANITHLRSGKLPIEKKYLQHRQYQTNTPQIEGSNTTAIPMSYTMSKMMFKFGVIFWYSKR